MTVLFLIDDPVARTTLTNAAEFVTVVIGGTAMLLIEHFATRRDQIRTNREKERASQAHTAAILNVANTETSRADKRAT